MSSAVDPASVIGRRASRSSVHPPDSSRTPFTDDQISSAFGIPGLTLGEQLLTWKAHSLWRAKAPDGRQFVVRDLDRVVGGLVELAPRLKSDDPPTSHKSTKVTVDELNRRIATEEQARESGLNIPRWLPAGAGYVAIVGEPPRAVVVQEWIEPAAKPFSSQSELTDYAWKRGEQYALHNAGDLRYKSGQPRKFDRREVDWEQLYSDVSKARASVARRLEPLLPFLKEVNASLFERGYFEGRIVPDGNVTNCVRQAGSNEPFLIDALDREPGPLDLEMSQLFGGRLLSDLDKHAVRSARIGVGGWIATMDGYFAGFRSSGQLTDLLILQAQFISTFELAHALGQSLESRSSRNPEEVNGAFERVMACRFVAAAQPELESRSWAIDARNSAHALAHGRVHHGGAVL